MSIYVVSEQIGLDGFWITDILKGIKAEADKKNLAIEDIYLPTGEADGEGRLVLAVGYTKGWIEQVAAKIHSMGSRSIIVNASPDCGIYAADAFVCFDYAAAMNRLAEYLKYCGKTRVAFLGCGGRLSYDCKNKAFQSAAGKNGIYCRSYKYSGIAELTASFLREYRSFDAVVCSRDAEAFHLISALNKRKIYVPEDIYVASIGGNLMSEYSVPKATTIITDFKELGAAAVKLHRFLSQNPELRGVTVSIDCSVAVRGSTENKPFPKLMSEPPLRHSNYRTDPEYLSYLRAEALVRGCDKLDRNILLLLSKGKNMAEIAEEKFISQSSVKYRVKKMLKIADVTDRRELIKIAQIYGLL